MEPFGAIISEIQLRDTEHLGKTAGDPHQQFLCTITIEDVSRWSTAVGMTPRDVCHELSIRLARGFLDGMLSFDLCDKVVNKIDALFIFNEEIMGIRTALSWDVYLAFDEGEYYHENNRNEDRVEVYTRPLLLRSIAPPAEGQS